MTVSHCFQDICTVSYTVDKQQQLYLISHRFRDNSDLWKSLFATK